MPQTPLSSTSSYCTATQFVSLVDWRSVADFLSDDGTRLPSQAAVTADENLARILMLASGELESSVLVGGRYRPEDLREIADADPATNATELLAAVVAGLALPHVWRRRPDRTHEQLALEAWAAGKVQAVENGSQVFPTEENTDAGAVDSIVENARVIERRQQATVIAQRYFGRRGDRRDPNRQ